MEMKRAGATLQTVNLKAEGNHQLSLGRMGEGVHEVASSPPNGLKTPQCRHKVCLSQISGPSGFLFPLSEQYTGRRRDPGLLLLLRLEHASLLSAMSFSTGISQMLVISDHNHDRYTASSCGDLVDAIWSRIGTLVEPSNNFANLRTVV